MDERKMTMQDFIVEVARPRGLTVDFVEANCRRAMECSHDWKIYIGSNADLIVVPVDSIKIYFDLKNQPKPAPASSEPPLLRDFMVDPEKPVEEGKKVGGKK